jgi:hypothetical protein
MTPSNPSFLFPLAAPRLFSSSYLVLLFTQRSLSCLPLPQCSNTTLFPSDHPCFFLVRSPPSSPSQLSIFCSVIAISCEPEGLLSLLRAAALHPSVKRARLSRPLSAKPRFNPPRPPRHRPPAAIPMLQVTKRTWQTSSR